MEKLKVIEIKNQIIEEVVDLYISNMACADPQKAYEMRAYIDLYMNDYVRNYIYNAQLDEGVEYEATEEEINEIIEEAKKYYNEL